MNRIFYIILLLLLLVTGGVLAWQWNIYSENKSDSDFRIIQANETIDIAVTDQAIEINHGIAGLPAGNYVIQNSKDTKVTCQKESKNCQITSNDQLKTNGGTIQLTYQLKKPKASAYVLKNWAVSIKDVNMTQTHVELTHYGKNIGIWAAGATLVGQTKKENISYFVFTGNDGAFPLYYQNKALTKDEKNGFTVYGDSNHAVMKAAEKYEVEPPFTFIISNKVDSFTSTYLLIRPNKEYIVQVLSNRFYNKNYPFKKQEETWLQSLIATYVLDEKAAGKPKKLMTELESDLSKEQLDQFISLLKKNRGHNFSAQYLDTLLSEAAGMDSDYFIRNKSEKSTLRPLYFINQATWYDDNGEETDIESITLDSKRYYSLTQVAQQLGFKMERISSTHLFLSDGSRSFRLYPGKPTFLYNEKAYSIKGELLKEFNNEFYISEDYMLKVFSVFVREKDNELQLLSLH